MRSTSSGSLGLGKGIPTITTHLRHKTADVNAILMLLTGDRRDGDINRDYECLT